MRCRTRRLEWQQIEEQQAKRMRIEQPQVIEDPMREPAVDVPMDLADVGMPPASPRVRITGMRTLPATPCEEEEPDKRARLLEILMAEPSVEEQLVHLEDPALWWPVDDVRCGDQVEFLLLGDRGVLEQCTWDDVPATAQMISSRVLRKPKGQASSRGS
jgi:hypothetical protein